MYAGCLFISSPKNSAVVVVHAAPKLQLRNQVCVWLWAMTSAWAKFNAKNNYEDAVVTTAVRHHRLFMR